MSKSRHKNFRVHFVSGRYAACVPQTKFLRLSGPKRRVLAINLRQGDRIECLGRETVSHIEHNPA